MKEHFESYRQMMHKKKVTKILHQTIITVVGFSIIILGVILMPLPGPGSLIVLLGVAILATEFLFAQIILHKTVRLWDKFRDKYLSRFKKR